MNRASKTMLSLGMILGATSMPAHAKETSEQKQVSYQVSYKNEDSVLSVVQDLYGDKLGSLKLTDSDSDTYTYESNTYTVEVDGIDIDQEGAQEVTFTLTSKTSTGSNTTVDASALTTSSKVLLANNGSSVVETQTIDIQDTTAPTLNITSTNIETTEGTSVDLSSYVTATDNKDGDVTVSFSEIDYSNEGTYTVTATAVDAAGNSTSQDLTVTISKDTYYQTIADAALAQVGVNQDCTMLVTNSLAAVGIDFHGWPEDYLSLGELTDTPVPGDIIVYSGHVAIYIGDGQAVHGGYNGYTTVVSSVECSNTLIGYVHVTKA